MHQHSDEHGGSGDSDIAAGDALVARLIELDPTGGKTWSEPQTKAHQALYRHAHDQALLADPAWLDWLSTMAAHPSHVVRAIAVSALGAAGDPARQPIIVNALSDPAPWVAAHAVKGLTAQSVDDVFDQLVDMLNQTGNGVVWGSRHAAQRIAESSHPKRMDVLAHALGQMEPADTHDITQALMHAGDRRVAPVLIEHLRDRRPGRYAAAVVLGHLRVAEATSELIDVLPESDDWQAMFVLEALGKIGSPESAPAVVAMLDRSSARVRERALRALSHIGGPMVVPAALTATDDGDPFVRRRAIRVLAKHGDHRALGRLAAACDGWHARIALTGLVRLADASVAPTLVDVLVTTTDRRTRKLAGRALVNSGAQTYLSGWDPDPLVRRVLVWVIGQRAGAAANDIYVLVNAMKDEDELVRARAAAALGRITDAKTLAPLTEALRDPKPRVRANAATALGRTAPADLHTLLADSLADPHPAVRAAATAALRPAATHVTNSRATSDGPDTGR
jgi:HEAT repeat protein